MKISYVELHNKLEDLIKSIRQRKEQMTEKKFITSFIEYLDNEKWRGIIPNYDAIDEWLNDWLIEHHKTYREVYFYKRDLKIVEMQKEQVRIKLKDFLNFAFCHFDSTFVDEIVEKYINERLYR